MSNPLTKTINMIGSVSTFLIPVLILMSAYNAVGHYVSETRPAVSGVVEHVLRNQGKHHITDASVIFPSAEGNRVTCRVETWFRGTDKGIEEGALIRVVPSLTTNCGTPWFPDHIPPTREAIEMALGSAIVSVGLFFCRRYVKQHPTSTMSAEIEQLSSRDLADMGVDRAMLRSGADSGTSKSPR